jgi:hypothetical protein
MGGVKATWRPGAPKARRCGAALLLLLFALVATTSSAPVRAEDDIGHEGPSYAGAAASPTEAKPESKLWWHDGFWWGVLFSEQARTFRIHRLDRPNGTWVDTGVTVDRRNTSRADALPVGHDLYVATHVWAPSNRPASPSQLVRFRYEPAGVQYVPVSGYPARINDQATPSLVIDRERGGRLWATWVQDGRVHVSCSEDEGRSWNTAYVPQTTEGTGAVVATLAQVGDGMGLMWADEATGNYWFAQRGPDDPVESWSGREVAMGGPGLADDHAHLRATSDGRVIAVVKTGVSRRIPVDLIVVLERLPDGTWRRHPVSSALESNTRAVLLLDEARGQAHVLSTGPQPPSPDGQRGGRIVIKSASLATLDFPPGPGRPLIQDADSPNINNVTSTKQLLSSETGLVALATNGETMRYWHADDPVNGTVPLRADFAGTPRSTVFVPREVAFLDRSTGRPTSWSWDFGDGSPPDATANPTHVYERPGRYTVTLTVTGAAEQSTTRRDGFILVGSGGGRRQERGDDPRLPLAGAVGACVAAVASVGWRLRRRRRRAAAR